MPAQLSGVSPPNGWVRLSPATVPLLTFDGPIDPDSLQTTRASITAESGRPIPAVPFLASPTAVQILPEVALPHGSWITVTIEGLAGLDGGSVDPIHTTFQTHEPPLVALEVWNLGKNLRRFHHYDERGRLDSIDMKRRGETVQLEIFSYNEASQLVRWVRYGDAGDDAAWMTGDDLVYEYQTYVHAESHVDTRYMSNGANREWLDEDDEVWSILRETYEEGRVQSGETITRGKDDTLGTEDDEVVSYFTNAYDDYGALLSTTHHQRSYDGTEWYAYRDLIRRGEHGQIEQRTTVYSPGPDGLWETDDDTISETEYYEYDSRGLLTRVQRRDGDWVGREQRYTYEGSTLVERRDFNSSGRDGEWGTADDYWDTRWEYLPPSPPGPADPTEP